MAVAQGPLSAAVLLLVSLGLHGSSSLPACPEPCTCQRAPLLNCSSSGLSLVPQRIEDSVTELDLSHNLLDSATLDRPHPNLRTVWLGNNSITRLSLCIEGNPGGRHVRGRHLHGLRSWSGQGCVPWAPTLQLLSVERNQLEELPEGLEGCESLQVLQLSFNRISTLRPGDLSQLRQLVELHLDHNLITSLHPQMFQDLAQLRVLDLSFNKLTSVHPLTYLSLQNLRADVRLGGNMWQCDCSMRSLRRRMAYDSSRGQRVWSVVCASPSALSGRDLLQLEEDDLNCFNTEDRPELHQDVTVYRGSEILLSCSAQDSMWWTPRGQASVSQPQAGLLISDITDRDMGLYVCVSEEREVASVFNLQISKIGGARRKTRSVSRTSQQIIPQGPPNRIGQERNVRATSGDLTLAVCLSVFITFLIAFILGVLARPCIDILWKKVTKKRTSTGANSVSNVEQRQYDNEAYSTVEEIEQTGHHRERRVTFSTVDVTENSNVQYYDTVAGVEQESVSYSSVFECEAANAERDAHSSGDSGSENGLRQSSRNKDFEHIPDPAELGKRRGSSSSSDSSVSDQMTQRDHTKPKTPQLAEDSVQQRADLWTARTVEVPQISVEGSEIPGFPSEPFADWSPHAKNPNLTDPDLWEGNEEQFEFSDSVQSISPRPSSAHGSFKKSKLIMPPSSNRQRRDDTSSSSSYVSEDEPTAYTVNSDHEEELIEKNHNKPEITNASLKQDASLEKQIRGVDLVRPKHSFSSHSSDSDGEASKAKRKADKGEGKHKSMHVSEKLSSRTATGESDTREKVKPMPRTKWRVPSLGVTSHSTSQDTKAPSPPAASSSSSSSESEAEITDRKVKDNTGRVNEGIKISEPKTLSTDLDRQHIPKIKRPVDINAPLRASDSTSSDESKDETAKHKKKQKQGDVNIVGLPVKGQSVSHLGHATPIKRDVSLDIRAPSSPTDSSSSSESADETMDQKQRQGPTPMPRLQFPESQTVSHHSDTRWPAIDLEHIPRTKSGLNIKAPSPASESSSSSESDDETTNHIKTWEKGKTLMARPPIKEPQTGTHDQQTQRPALNLEQTTHLKRHVDIKAPSLASDSSSSSDSEGETTGHIEKQRPGKVDIAGHRFQKSQKESPDLGRRWPVLDLEQTTRVKRRLDIKAPSPGSDSSSSSDSEDGTTGHIQKQRPGKVGTVALPLQQSQTGSQWPALDLEQTTRVKRRLDIKAPSPASDSSSSSSDSEDETTHHIKKERPGLVGIARLPFQQSQTVRHDPETRWPAVDLGNITRIKRCLDIKAPSPASDSSSSSDSEDETTNYIKKQEKGETHMARLPTKVSQTTSHDPQTQGPVLDLGHTTRIKTHLDSSSSSDSEGETTGHKEMQRPAKVVIAGLPFQESQTVRHGPDTRRPALDLEHSTRIKRHLDIKAPSQAPDSSSSSDSEDETTNYVKKQEQGKTHMASLPTKVSQSIPLNHDPKTQWSALDLGHTASIKRHPEVKAPSPTSESSSSSDSENETTHHTKQERPGLVVIAGVPFRQSQTARHDPETRWPAVDLGNITRIKRRLDIKTPPPPPDSLSSAGSTNHVVKVNKEAAIKSNYSSSSSDEQEGGMENLRNPPTTAEPDPDSRWPKLDLRSTHNVKRRMDITTRSLPPESFSTSVSPGTRQSESNSSTSDSEDENRDHAKLGLGVSAISKDTGKGFIKYPKSSVIHTSPKTDHNIILIKKTPLTDDVGNRTTSDNMNTMPEINPELKSRWATMNLGISRFRKRLEITPPTHEPPNPPSSPPPDSPSSPTSARTRRKRWGAGMQGIIHAESSLASENKSVNSSLSLKGQDDNFGNSVEVKETLRKDYSLPKAEEKSNPDTTLTSYGHPHFRRYLDINVTEKAPATPPLRKLSDSSSSSENEDASREHAGKGWRGRSQLPVVTDKEASQIHPSQYVLPAAGIKLDVSQSQNEEVDNIPHIRRAPNIRAPLQREASFSSNSENETIGHSVPDLSRGVPHVKRSPNVKAPSHSTSSSSDSENEVTEYTAKQSGHASDMSGLTDIDSIITYRRSIFKGSSLQTNSFSHSGPTMDHRNQIHTGAEMVTLPKESPSQSVGDSNAPLAPRRAPSMSFDDGFKKRTEQPKNTTDADLPPEIRWAGVGRQLSDLSTSSPRRHLDVGSSAPPAEPEFPLNDFSDYSSGKSDQMKQDRGKADVTLLHKYSSLSANSVSLASSRAHDNSDNLSASTNEILRGVPEDRWERKGLSALKVMSSERQKWDTQGENLPMEAPPVFDDHGPQYHSLNYLRYEEDIKPLAKQPLTGLHISSTSGDDRRAPDFMYGIPHYRRHNIGGTAPPQEAPPPVPATPPPDEAVELTWSSPQSFKKQGLAGTRSHLQQSRNTEEPDPSQNLGVYFNSPNISHV